MLGGAHRAEILSLDRRTKLETERGEDLVVLSFGVGRTLSQRLPLKKVVRVPKVCLKFPFNGPQREPFPGGAELQLGVAAE